MKRTSTLLEMFKKSFLLLFCFAFITLLSTESYGQTKKRVYADAQANGPLGLCLGCSVINSGGAIDGNPYTSSKIDVVVALGGFYQELIFPAGKLPGANKGAVVKLSSPELLSVALLGAIKLRPYNGSTPVGTEIEATDGLLSLLASGNQSEVFVPAPGVTYDRIRISVRGLLGLLNAINVYHAYYLEDAPGANCDNPIEELHGIEGAVIAVGDVTNPLNAIDGSDLTHSTFNATAKVASYIQQTVIFPGLSKIGDSVRIVLSVPNALVSADLLGSIGVETFNGNSSNNNVEQSSGLLSLKLLGGGSQAVVTFAPDKQFDRVKIRFGGVLNLLGTLNVHEVSRTMALPTAIDINNVVSPSGIACMGDGITLKITSPENGAIYKWYTQPTGGQGVAGTSFAPTGLATGVHDFYVSGQRLGCPNETPRKLVRVVVNNPTVPVVSTPNPICSGGTVTLVVNAPLATQTYRWYDAETGGALVFTGTNFVIPTLAASTSYYVESVIGSCVSARTKVDVTVNPIPANATVAIPNVEITSGQTATLTASAEAGNTVKWFTAANGGVAIFTGAIFKTPALTATTKYFVEVQSAGGCVSPARVEVTVTVTGIDPGLACNVPNVQGSGVDGLLCVLCGVENGADAINSDPTKFSSLRLTLGVGGQVYQRLHFPSAGAATDSIRLDLETPGGLTDLSLLGAVNINVMRNGVVVKSYPLNGGLLHLTLLSGDRYKATFVAGAEFDAVEIRLVGLVTALTTVNVYGAKVIYPNPTIPQGGFNACFGSDATLTATPIGSTTLKWFDLPQGGTELASGNTYSPTGLTADVTYYIEVSNGNCGNTERFPVTVKVNPAINFVAHALTNATIGSAYSKQITPATGGTPAFTYKGSGNIPAGLTISADGTIGGTPTAAAGDYSFTITATDSKGCSVDATYNLKVTERMSLPDMTLPNGTVNTLYPTQVIPEAIGGTSPYTYTASNLPPGLDFDPATREITGTPTQKGTYQVHVTATDDNGNSVTKDYTIVVRDPLLLPTTTLANGTVNVPYSTQTIPSATGGSGSYTYEATNLPPGLNFDPATREITGTPTQVGTFTIPVKVTDTEGNTITTDYTIVVGSPLLLATKPLADGTVGVVYATETIPSATGGDGNYTYTASNLPPGLTFDPATREISGTPTKSGSYNVSVKVTDGTGTTATQVYVVKVNGELNLPSANLPNGLVGTVYPTQTLPEVTGGTSPYIYTLDGLPPALTFDPLTREISGTPVTGGTFTLTMTATDKNGITTSTDYTLVVNVSAPVVAAVTTCVGSTATLTVSNADPSFTYKWYASSGSTSIYTGPTFTTDAINANTTFYVEAISGTAVSTRTPVNVTTNPAPDAPTVISANESISAGQSASLQVSTTAGNTIKWYTSATGGASFFTGEKYTTPALNATTIYYVETENALGCVSATRVAITVTVSAGPVNPNCNVAVGQETGIDGLCLLCSVNNPGGSTDSDPGTFTKINLAVGVGATGYQRLIFARSGVATDSIRLDLATPVGLADVNVLGGITVTVLNGNTVVSTYTLDNALIDLKLLGGNRFKATLPAGGVYDRVEVRFGALVAALSNLSIYGAEVIYPNPTVEAAGQLVCAGSGTTLTATANGGTTLKWFATATSTTVLATGETFTVAGPLTSDATYYIEVSKDGCAMAQRIPVNVVVTTAPAVPTTAANAEVCAGSPAVLTVNNPVTGITYKWYTSSTGGTAVFEGAVFTTPALNANTNYYVEAANGNCVSATRAAVAVKVNPLPVLPQVQVSSNTVSLGQTAILNASSTESNVIFNWYSAADATTPIYTGPTYVTTPLMVTTTYYLEAVSTTTGCAASNRVQITINVDGNGTPNSIPCEAAVTETNGVDGIALLAGVFNPQLAIDDDTKTGSSLVVPVGLLGGSVYQRVGFTGLSTIGDTVRVKLTSPGKLLSLGVLSGITLTTYNGATSNGDALALTNALINLELLSGNTEALLSFIPTKAFDVVEVRLNAGIAGVLTTVDLNYAQRVMVAPTVTASVVNICATQPATLSVANPNPVLIYKWYDNTGAYIAGKDGTTFVTDPLTANTKFYVAASNAANCISYKSVIDVKVSAAPAIPELESPIITTCANNDVILRVKNPIPGIIYKWSGANGPYPDGTTLQVTVGLTSETYTVVAVDNTCGITSAAATATIEVGDLDIPIITPPSITVKVNTPALLTASSTTAGVIFKWYDAPTGGQLLETGNTFLAPAQPTPGVITYYVEGSIPGGCTTITRATVQVTTIPNDGSTDVPCEPAITEVNGKEGVVVLGGVFNPELAVDDDASTASSLVVPVGLLDGAVFQQLGFDGISNLGDTVRILLTSPGKILSLSVLPSLEISTLKNGTSNNDATIISNAALINLELLSGGTQALLTFVPTSTFDAVQVKLKSGLASAFTSIDINYAQRVLVAPTVAAKTANACEGSSATLSINNPMPNVTYKWYKGTVFMADGGTFNTPTDLTAGNHDFFVVAERKACPSVRVKVVVTIMPVPAPPVADAGNQASTCIGSSVTLKVTPVSGVVYNWYDAEVGGNLLVANNISYTTPANLAANTYNYFVEAVNANSCTNATRVKITLIVKANAIATDITAADASICSGSTATLTATAPGIAGAIFKWYTTPALTDTPVEGDSFTTPALTVTTKYYVTVSGTEICANDASSAKVVTVTVNRNAIASDIVATGQTICSGTAANLTASTTKVKNPVFSWYKNDDLSDQPFVGANFTTDLLTATTKYYVTVSGSDACANDAASSKVVTVIVNRNATAADIDAADRTTCIGTAVTLKATSTTVVNNPVFSWYRDADLTDLATKGDSFTTPTLNATTKYYVTVSGSDVCANDANSVKIVTVTVNRNATSSDIDLLDQTICAGTTAILEASSKTVDNPVFRWYRDASLTDFAFSGPTFTTPALTVTTKYYVTVSGTNACANDVTSAKVVTVSVTRNAGLTDIIAVDQAICSGAPAQLTASSATVNNPIFTWYRDAALTNVEGVGENLTITGLTATTRFYVTVKGDGVCANLPGSAKMVTVTVNPVPNVPIIDPAGTAICSGDATKLTIQNSQVGVIYEWYTSATGGDLKNTGPVFNTGILNASVDYYVQATNTTNCGNVNGRVKVTVVVTGRPQTPSVVSGTVNTCLGSTAVLSVTGAENGVVYNWYATATSTAILGTGTQFTTPVTTVAVTTYYVEATSGSCISTSRTPVVVNAGAIPLPPPSVSGAEDALCPGSTTVLTVNNPDGALKYTWYTSATGGTGLADGTTFNVPALSATTIYYVGSSSNSTGCTSATRTAITVTVLGKLDAPVVSTQSATATSITFAWPAVTGATAYEVSEDNGLNWKAPSSGVAGTTHLISGLQPDQKVTIRVRAAGQLACQLSDATTFTGTSENPLGNNIFVPNTFTPNNDGQNDVFYVYGNTIAKMQLRVYSQWGQFIYESLNIQNGWDGTYKGQMQPNGVYVYYLEVEFNDGTKATKKGTITLLR